MSKNNRIVSNFQRSQSKVWWSDFDAIQEKHTYSISYSRHGSPSSHKSQDSGFSDSEISPPLKTKLNTNKSPLTTPKKISPVLEDDPNQNSPSSVEATPNTPPTVIRKHSYHNSDNRENFTSRRISFSEPSINTTGDEIGSGKDENDNENIFHEQIDKLNYSPTKSENTIHNSSHDHKSTNIHKQEVDDDDEYYSEEELEMEVENDFRNRRLNNNSLTSTTSSSSSSSSLKCDRDRSIKRGRVISRSSKYNRSLSLKHSDHENQQKTISTTDNNIKISSNISLDEQNNNKSVHPNSELMNSFDEDRNLPMRTSTPKPFNTNDNFPPKCVLQWMSELRMSTHHEVMSTLQTKSIAAEAGRNLRVTSAIAAKVIRTTQTKAMCVQNDFEKIEKLIANEGDENVISMHLHVLANGLIDFMDKQKSRITIYCETENDFKQFGENITNICEISNDLRCVAMRLDEYDLESIRENVLILKRYTLITIRLIFVKLIKIIIDAIEEASCDMILRSNLSTLSLMSNIEYSGFASLNAAFLANGTIRVLLLHIIESQHSSIRALALRALATVCSTKESIKQFEQAGGMDVLKEIMTDQRELRCDPELRESVSVLTQLTAPWHGVGHTVAGLKDCIDSFVEVITEILSTTGCCQTILLCAACLNNFSRLESTSVYSIMSHGTVKKLQIAVENRGPAFSIFLAEQVTSMLLNMANNKRCHNHLGNKQTIAFITKIFQSKFYDKYTSKSESDSHKKTIKNILHIISRLIHEAIISPDILEEDVLPIFMQIENNMTRNGSTESEVMYSKDLTFLNKKLNESLTYKHNHSHMYKNSPLSTSKKRQESFV